MKNTRMKNTPHNCYFSFANSGSGQLSGKIKLFLCIRRRWLICLYSKKYLARIFFTFFAKLQFKIFENWRIFMAMSSTYLFSFKHKTKVLICELTIEIENFLEKENHLKCEWFVICDDWFFVYVCVLYELRNCFCFDL